MSFLDRFRKARRETSAEINALLVDVRAAIPVARKTLDDIEMERGKALLDASVAEMSAFDQRLAAAEREVTDLDLVRASLEAKLAEALKAEQLGQLEKLAAEAAKIVDRQTAIIVEAGPLAARLAELAEEFTPLVAKLRNMHEALSHGGAEHLWPEPFYRRLETTGRKIEANPFGSMKLEAIWPQRSDHVVALDELAKLLKPRK